MKRRFVKRKVNLKKECLNGNNSAPGAGGALLISPGKGKKKSYYRFIGINFVFPDSTKRSFGQI